MGHKNKPSQPPKPEGILLGCDTYYPLVDGVVRMVEDTHQYYLDQNITSYVACAYFPNGKDHLPNIIRLPSIPVPGHYRLAVPRLKNPLLSSIEPNSISVVHVYAPFILGRTLLRWARLHNKPCVLTFPSKFYEKFINAPPPLRWFSKPVYRALIRFCNKFDIITTLSESFKKILIQHGIDEKKLYVVPFGVPPLPALNADSKKFRTNPILKKIREQKRLNKFILLYVGQLIKEKNPDLLIQSLFELQKKGFPFYCVVVGMGDQYKNLKKLIQKLNLNDLVLMTKAIHDKDVLHQIYKSSDLFTFPSTYETQGLVVFEAAQHGLPTLGIKEASGISDFVFHQETGYLADLCPKSYANEIHSALSNKDLYKKVSASAKKNIPVSVEEMIAKYEVLYEKAAQVR